MKWPSSAATATAAARDDTPSRTKMFANGAYPPNTLLMIDRLVKEELLVEVQAVAAI